MCNSWTHVDLSGIKVVHVDLRFGLKPLTAAESRQPIRPPCRLIHTPVKHPRVGSMSDWGGFPSCRTGNLQDCMESGRRRARGVRTFRLEESRYVAGQFHVQFFSLSGGTQAWKVPSKDLLLGRAVGIP